MAIASARVVGLGDPVKNTTQRHGEAFSQNGTPTKAKLIGFDFEKPELDKLYTRFLLMADERKQLNDEDLKELVG